MKPVFKIPRIGAQDRQPTIDTFLKKEFLDDISNRLIGSKDYEVQWIEERIKGNLIRFETKKCNYYICLSEHGDFDYRNSQLQKVPTAFSQFLHEQKHLKKECKFYFYFLPMDNNNKTDYLKFVYRLMSTCGILFLNKDFGLKDFEPVPFTSVKDIINARNDLKSRNSGNQSTFVTDEGDFYHIYGKTFGANQKETSLFCVAIVAISEKPIKLYQIIDNDAEKMSSKDVEAINTYVDKYKTEEFIIVPESMPFEEGVGRAEADDEIRDSRRFIYNLLIKTHGEKHCTLCGCKIESIVQAAHIYPISEIKRNPALTPEKKFEFAIDKDNGIWLCENHHKLFDRGLIWFEEGKLCIAADIDPDDVAFVKQITTIDEIEPKYVNDRMLAFFDLRARTEPRIAL